jgi:hypothetical protein
VIRHEPSSLDFRQFRDSLPQTLVPLTVEDRFLDALGRIQRPSIQRFVRQFRLLNVPLVGASQIALNLDEAQKLVVNRTGNLRLPPDALSVCKGNKVARDTL